MKLQAKRHCDLKIWGYPYCRCLGIHITHIRMQNNKITISKETPLSGILHQLPLTKRYPSRKKKRLHLKKKSHLAVFALDTFQDFLIAEHMKPCMHILEISISSLNHGIVRPTKTPKSANKKCQFLTFKVNFLCQKLSESF